MRSGPSFLSLKKLSATQPVVMSFVLQCDYLVLRSSVHLTFTRNESLDKRALLGSLDTRSISVALHVITGHFCSHFSSPGASFPSSLPQDGRQIARHRWLQSLKNFLSVGVRCFLQTFSMELRAEKESYDDLACTDKFRIVTPKLPEHTLVILAQSTGWF